jgi:hypothetical protein
MLYYVQDREAGRPPFGCVLIRGVSGAVIGQNSPQNPNEWISLPVDPIAFFFATTTLLYI